MRGNRRILANTKDIINGLHEYMSDFREKHKDGDKIPDDVIDHLIANIVSAFKYSNGTLNNAVNKIFGQNDDGIKAKVTKFIKGVLKDVKVGDKNYNKFVSHLKIDESNNTPFSLNTDTNLGNPNIMAEIVFYSKYPELGAEIRDKLMTEDGVREFKENKFNELIAEKERQLEELIYRTDLTKKEQEKQIEKLKNEIAQAEYEKEEALKGVKIAKEGFNYVVGGIKDIKDNSNIQNTVLGELLKKNKSDILNDVALRLAGDPDLKKNIRKIKGDLKASNPTYSDGDINYIITKALSENDRYLKTVAANPDLFDRDMSQDTIQKENEQFQSKLRQQNLRYILPKFIERREKLVENTLNPELLKGAFAI